MRKAYGELSEAYKVVENAHEELCLLLEEDDDDASDSYLDDVSDSLSEMQLKVNKMIADKDNQEKVANNEAEKKKEYEGILATFKTDVQNFGKPSANLLRLSSSKTISYVDMRKELEKIEASMAKLHETKAKVIQLNPTADLVAVHEQFNSLVVDEVDSCKRIALEYVKDAPAVVSDAVTGGGRSRSGFSTSKRETVMLPKFSGEEKTAYLKYPVWKQQWDDHIQE